MTAKELFDIRTAMLRLYMDRAGYDGLLLTRTDNFAMATGGRRNYVNSHADLGANSLFVPREGAPCFVGNAIEAPRQMAEELDDLGCEALAFPWFEGSAAATVQRHFQGRLASDDGALGDNINGALAPLRALLLEPELEKYRKLGQRTAEAVTEVLDTVKPGVTEAEIAAQLTAKAAEAGCRAPVVLVAADERIAAFRHPLPSYPSLLGGRGPHVPVRRYVMVAVGYIREGLTVSMTRFRAVGGDTAKVEQVYARICAVDARIQEATRPGRTLGEVFEDIQAAYVAHGFHPDEWHNHHQGGPTGYAGRTCKASPGEAFEILPAHWTDAIRGCSGQNLRFGTAFAWNPSAPGVKSEDTFLLHESGEQEIITRTPALVSVDLEGQLEHPTNIAKAAMRFRC